MKSVLFFLCLCFLFLTGSFARLAASPLFREQSAKTILAAQAKSNRDVLQQSKLNQPASGVTLPNLIDLEEEDEDNGSTRKLKSPAQRLLFLLTYTDSIPEGRMYGLVPAGFPCTVSRYIVQRALRI